jgi:predicted nucleic acid-binding Zn ribbon protein
VREYVVPVGCDDQLAESVIDEKTYRQCLFCDKPFEVSQQRSRSDREYCSGTCRVKAYQRRRKRAIKMREEGSALSAIAKAVGSDVKTVKKWVKGTSRKE